MYIFYAATVIFILGGLAFIGWAESDKIKENDRRMKK